MPLLSVDSKLVRFLGFLFDLVVLNLLTVASCLPLVTVGAAFAALYHAVEKLREGNGGIFREYVNALRDNLRHGLVLGVFFILMCSSFFLYIVLFQDLIAKGDSLVLSGIVLVGVIFFFPMTFAFPILAKFESTALRTLANAFLLSFRHAGTTLAVLALYGLPWLILAVDIGWFLRALPLWVMFGFSFPAWVSSRLFLKVFRNYAEL